MPDSHPTAMEHLEQAREVLWETIQMLEKTQRMLFKAGDRYVADVWGDGVRAILEVTERITDLSGDLMSVHIEIGHIARRDRGRPADGE